MAILLTHTCEHTPCCPAATDPGHDLAVVVFEHHDQGWVRLCNNVIVFDDTGDLLPSRQAVAPHRPAAHYAQAV